MAGFQPKHCDGSLHKISFLLCIYIQPPPLKSDQIPSKPKEDSQIETLTWRRRLARPEDPCSVLPGSRMAATHEADRSVLGALRLSHNRFHRRLPWEMPIRAPRCPYLWPHTAMLILLFPDTKQRFGGRRPIQRRAQRNDRRSNMTDCRVAAIDCPESNVEILGLFHMSP
jgi:hypothetical protein